MSATLEDLCQLMHDTYEAAAIRHGWHTNERSRQPWSQVPEENRASMRDAVAVVVEAVREDEKAKRGPDVVRDTERAKHHAETMTMQSDLIQIMDVLGISTHARNGSPHEVVQKEIIPKLHDIAKYNPDVIQADLIKIMTVLGTNAPARYSPHQAVQNEILPRILKMKNTLVEVKELLDRARNLT